MSLLRFRIFLLLALAASLPACSMFQKKSTKPSAHIYEGDAPTMRFTDRPEKPGGEVNPY